MQPLLNFLMKYSTAMLFIVLLVVGCILLFTGNVYQRSVYMTSANAVSSSVYGVSNGVTGYFHLRSVNEGLARRNAALETELLNLREQMEHLRTLVPLDSTEALLQLPGRFDYCVATVINNSVTSPRNYFTINKGAMDGLEPGQGVVSHDGIAGIVGTVGPNASRVISLLNVTQNFSVKVKGSDAVGITNWKEGNPDIAYVSELPRHVVYHIGDTVVTSGYSNTFPEGIPVGVIMSQVKTGDDNFFTLKIRLTTDFSALSSVRVIKDHYKAEMDSLMKFDAKPQP